MAMIFDGAVQSLYRVGIINTEYHAYFPSSGDTIYNITNQAVRESVSDTSRAAWSVTRTRSDHSPSTLYEIVTTAKSDIFGPAMSGSYTAFHGSVTVTATRACRIWTADPNGDIVDLIATVPSSGTYTYTFATSEIATRAMKDGLEVYYPQGVTPNASGALSNLRMTFVYSDISTLPTVTPVSPQPSSTVLAENATVFEWRYSHPTIQQSGWALHYVRNGADTVLDSGTGTASSCTVPAGTFETGTAQWYVTVTAEEEGYTLTAQTEPQYMIIRTNPSTSDVTTDGKPRLTVSWTASSQQAAQVRVGDTLYPTIFSSAGSYTLPEALDDGVYPVTVRTQTTEGDWSEWSETVYADIRNEPPSGAAAPQLSWQLDGTVAALSWTAVSGASAYMLYRNNVPVYAGDGTAWVDAEACGAAEYYVRAVFSSGDYVQSDTATLYILPAADTLIYDAGGIPRQMTVRHHPEYPVREWSESAGIELKEYSGRTLPVAVSDGHMTRSLTLTAAYRSPGEAAALLSLLGKTVIYKSRKGESCRGVIVSASRESGLTDAVTYSISATDGGGKAWLT